MKWGKQHQSSNRHMHVPTDHFWGCVGGFEWGIVPHATRLATESKFTIVRVLLMFLDVYILLHKELDQ